MRLVETTGPQHLPHSVFPAALEDMQALYGGSVTEHTNETTRKLQRTLVSNDELVMALAHGRRPKETLVGFNRLHYRDGSQRWTALQAYRNHGGQKLGYLDTELSGLHAYKEWAGFHQPRKRKGGDDFFTSPVEYISNDKDPQQYTIFHARGNTLPEAAHKLADEYREFLSRTEEPDLVVAHALGARSLEHLDMVWAGAMEESTPLAAGRFVLSELTRVGVGNV